MSTTSTDTSNIPVTIIVSGLFACAVAILVSLAIERFGGVVGGVLGSIPTTIVPAAYGFWVQFSGKENGVSEFQRALMSVSPGMVLNGGFLILWRYLPNIYRRWFPGISMYRLLASVLITSTMIWLGFAVSLVTILRAVNEKKADMTIPYTIGIGFTGLLIICGVLAGWKSRPAPRGRAKIPFFVIIVRGLFAGVFIGLSILISSFSAYAGGVVSVFPIIFMTSMVSVWISSGEQVSSGAIAPLMLGSSSVGVFAISASFIAPLIGFAGAAVICWIVSVLVVSVPSFLYLRWRLRVGTEPQTESVTELNS